MTLEELNEKYNNVPEELKKLKRWVCYRVEERDGRKTKVPVNSLSGNYAKSNDSMTWSKFSTALAGSVKYNCDGIGFMLGDGIFGVDLDNHPDSEGVCMSSKEFNELAYEFVNALDSYAEFSLSGLGVHIICYGSLPKGRRRKGNVEMYDSCRFFAFTGNALNNVPLKDCQETIIPLWEKYVDDSQDNKYQAANPTYSANNKYNFLNYDADFKTELKLSDQELIAKACASKNGYDFSHYYKGGMPLTGQDRSHSAADMAFCSMLAFWCNRDKNQMDRIFRSSGLMRPKWDQMRGHDTYGNITLESAIRSCTSGFVNLVDNKPVTNFTNFSTPSTLQKPKNIDESDIMNIDENGEPIFRIKKIFHRYSYDDTGNALRFYDYFGELFKYNVTDKKFMFWTGKTWIRDVKEIHRKYATKLIDILHEEIKDMVEEKEELKKQGDIDKADDLEDIIDIARKNAKRLANKAGKDAMISELQAIKDIAVVTEDFDKDEYLLNTDSGVVDLRTGKIDGFDPKYMLSKNTNTKVSFEEPTVWIKFLHDIFKRDNKEEEDEVIECIQQCVGYSLSGSIDQQCFFICYGNGSNGKSTFSGQISHILGEYATTTPVSTLLQPATGNNSSLLFSLAKLKGARYVETGETNEGDSFAEGTIKSLTGDSKISAAYKFGNEFEFAPTFKIWMSTNNKPFIKGSDYGIWRRVFLFPFLRTFTEKEKDVTLPGRLKAESDKILGWAIQGFLKFKERGKLFIPNCIEEEKEAYKTQMDGIARFISRACSYLPGNKVSCRTLYQNYSTWTKDTGTFKMSERKFEEKLREKGITQIMADGELSYVGIKLNTDKTKGYEFKPYEEGMA